jgi:spore germination protein YaaH
LLAIFVLLALVAGVSPPGVSRAADPTASPAPLGSPSPAAGAPEVSASPTPGASASPSATTPASDAAPDGSVVLSDGSVLPPMPEALDQPSIHAQMLETVGAGTFTFSPGGSPTILLGGDGSPKAKDGAAVLGLDGTTSASSETTGSGTTSAVTSSGTTSALPNGLRKEVFGFLPYWMLSSTDSMNYQLLSTIAYFSVGAGWDGYLVKSTSTGWSGWNSTQMTDVINRAHARGVKVVLTVTMMAWDSTSRSRMATFLRSATYRARLVSQVAAAVKARGADGVNLDFEPVASAERAYYTSFVRQMKAGLVSAGAGAYLTADVTGGAATWASGYDVSALVASGAADRLFVMGYDYNYSGSARAGGVAPIDSPYVLDVNTSMSDFLSEVSGSKLIWGVPYYGRTWTTTSNVLNAVSSGADSDSYYYTGHLAQAAKYGRLWDSVGKVPWYRYWSSADSSWVEGYYDDATSLAYKYDLINERSLAGTGMWTLLMDSGRDELWRLLANKFVTDSDPPSGGVRILPETWDNLAIHASWNAQDYVSGIYEYNVQIRDRSSSNWTQWLVGTKATEADYLGIVGHSYEIRVQAIDMKGNAQPWSAPSPAKPVTVAAGAFARVNVSSLNLRSGAGTSFGIIGTLAADDRVQVISGPVSASGYTWYQVQYGFAEWPSSEYARIGWAAVGDSSTAYLVPANAPNVTQLSPFVTAYARNRASFSPNDDGLLDTATMTYSLSAAVSSGRIDVLNSAGDVVTSWNIGAQASGSHSVSWDGRTSGGAVAPQGTYLLKLTVTDSSGASHVAPADDPVANVLARWGVTIDATAPKVISLEPAAGTTMLPASTRPAVLFSEPVANLTSSTVTLLDASGDSIASTLRYTSSTRMLSVTPLTPLPTGSSVTLRLSSAVVDAAGNHLAAASWSFGIAPGQAFDPWRGFIVGMGTHTGYTVGADGKLTGKRTYRFTVASGASTSQRAVLPNLPGHWLYVENGGWAGYWLPESSGLYLRGFIGQVTYPSTTRLTFREGTYVGRRFDASGQVTASKSFHLVRASGANATQRAVINGAIYWLVANGVWAGYWVPESASVYLAGFVDTTNLPGLPRVTLTAGTYTGYRYDSTGHRTGSLTATLGRASGASIDAAAVINGVAYYRVYNGIWRGTWLPVDSRIGFAA